jgi:8-oxo-dGTP pyrophosphatase MutT (NUDIX family)
MSNRVFSGRHPAGQEARCPKPGDDPTLTAHLLTDKGAAAGSGGHAMPMSPFIADLRAKIGSGLLLLPSATVVVYDEAGRVLLARDIDSGLWMTVGGAIEPDERPADAAIREFFEETGGRVELVRLIGVFGGPGFRKRYSNGDETAYVVTLFEGRIVEGTIAPDGVETSAIAYFTRAEMERLDLTSISRALIPYIFAPRDGDRAGFQPPTVGAGATAGIVTTRR